ncbi:MAG: hypothetical protein N2045_10095 [Fimbriimonadales bacterium]|jgi:hypothetical protein|nr:hypothetical protein [Fimbriimonadales bacterium]
MEQDKKSNAVVLVVDKHSLPVHLATLTAGVKYPVSYDASDQQICYTKEFFSILADLANIREGTRVFFYKRRVDEPPEDRGFIGEWAAIKPERANYVVYEDLHQNLGQADALILARCLQCGAPSSSLKDGKPVCAYCDTSLPGHILPLRFPLRLVQQFSHYVDDNTAYVDITDQGRLSTLIFRKVYGAGRERSVNPILPEEAEKLRRLLARVQTQGRNNPVQVPPVSQSHQPSVQAKPIYNYLNFANPLVLKRDSACANGSLYNSQGSVVYETILEFWLMRQLGSNPSFVYDYLNIPKGETVEWFGNQVLFGIGGEKSDVLVLTRNDEGKRCRAVVIELKRDTIDQQACNQIQRYAYWIAQLVTFQCAHQNPFYITPILIGYKTARGVSSVAGSRFTLPLPPSATAASLEVIVEPLKILRYRYDFSVGNIILF